MSPAITTAKLLAAFCSIVAALACASHPPRSSEDPDARARTVLVSEPVQTTIDEPSSPLTAELVPDATFACVMDEDCTVVEMGCCDSCNGGWQLAVNTKHVDHATQTWHEPSCASAACTKMACLETLSPVCDGGVCARREQETSENGEVRISIVRNVLPSR